MAKSTVSCDFFAFRFPIIALAEEVCPYTQIVRPPDGSLTISLEIKFSRLEIES